MRSETLHIDLSGGPDVCAVCRRELGDDEQRLTMDARLNGQPALFTVCRSCMAEYAPEALAVIEQDATKGLSL